MPSPPKASRRLAALADHVLADRPVADIGTDHAQLAVLLVTSRRVPAVVAVDRRDGPLRQGAHTVASAGCGDRVALRLGDGLAPLQPGEVGTIVVAGMGGGTIVGILTAGEAVARSADRLVLQPNEGARSVRDHLVATGWRIVAEDLVEERGRFYPIIVAEPGSSAPLDAAERLLGPRSVRPTGGAWTRWLQTERRRVAAALAGARRGGDDAVTCRLLAELDVLDVALRPSPDEPVGR